MATLLEINTIRQIGLLIALVTTLGCAPTAISVGQSVPRAQAKYDELVVGYFRGEQLSPEMRRKFTQSLQAKLIEQGVFQSVNLASSLPEPRPTQITLTGTFTEFNEGSRALQWFIGFGAGASKAGGSFELLDPEGKRLLQFSAASSYAGGIGIGGAPLLGMEDLLERLGAAVAEQTARWVRGEPMVPTTDADAKSND